MQQTTPKSIGMTFEAFSNNLLVAAACKQDTDTDTEYEHNGDAIERFKVFHIL
jgi:hypothetical protein